MTTIRRIDYYLCMSKKFERFNDPCTNCFNSLGVGSRMKIYKYLKKMGKKPVSEIVVHIGLKQPTVSYHLNEMKSSGLLKSVKRGKKVIYSIEESCPHHHVECFLNSSHFPEKISKKGW